MERPPAPPEAVLIRLAREAADIRVAVAAKGAGVSVARWSQIETGSETRNGKMSPVRAKAGTIARMAREIGISPERMAAEGERPDAAEIIREIIRQDGESQDAPPPAQPAAPRRVLPTLAIALADPDIDRYLSVVALEREKRMPPRDEEAHIWNSLLLDEDEMQVLAAFRRLTWDRAVKAERESSG